MARTHQRAHRGEESHKNLGGGTREEAEGAISRRSRDSFGRSAAARSDRGRDSGPHVRRTPSWYDGRGEMDAPNKDDHDDVAEEDDDDDGVDGRR